MNIGERLKQCRKEKKMTQEQVADTIRKLDADAYIRIFGGVEEG